MPRLSINRLWQHRYYAVACGLAMRSGLVARRMKSGSATGLSYRHHRAGKPCRKSREGSDRPRQRPKEFALVVVEQHLGVAAGAGKAGAQITRPEVFQLAFLGLEVDGT